VISVGDQRRAIEATSTPEAHIGGRFVAEKTNHARDGEDHEVRQRVRVDETLNRLPQRNTHAHEDRCDDKVAGTLLQPR
jgi:hypothetical protein